MDTKQAIRIAKRPQDFDRTQIATAHGALCVALMHLPENSIREQDLTEYKADLERALHMHDALPALVAQLTDVVLDAATTRMPEDARDYAIIVKLLRVQDGASAAEHWRSLDTGARDYIVRCKNHKDSAVLMPAATYWLGVEWL